MNNIISIVSCTTNYKCVLEFVIYIIYIPVHVLRIIAVGSLSLI